MATISGKNGKVITGSSDWAHVSNWSLTITSNNPQYGSSGTTGHKTSVAGVKSCSGTIEVVHDVADPLFEAVGSSDAVVPGLSVTLLLYENAARYWSIPARIESVAEEVDIDDGGYVTVTCEFTGMGAWTYPDLTISS